MTGDMEMMKRARTIGLLIALLATAAPATAQTVYNNGGPNGTTGPGADLFLDSRAADDFTFTGVLGVDLIRFWGLLPTGFAYTPTIFWQMLHDGGGGVPGSTVVAGGSVLAQATLRTSLANGFDSWQFDLAIGPHLLGPGIYWLALHDGPLSGTTESSLLWETTDASTGADFAVEFLPTNEWTGDWGGNLAFELHGATVTPEPVTLTLLGTGLLGLAGARWRRRRSSSK